MDRDEVFTPKPPATNDRIPFVVTYHPTLPNILGIIREPHPLLHMSQRCKVAVKEVPMMAFRRSKNLQDYLVRAQLRPAGQSLVGSSVPVGAFRSH